MPFTVTVPPQMAEELLEAAHRSRLRSEGPVLTQIIGILWPLLRQINYDFGALETFVRQHGAAEAQTGAEEHYLPDGKSEKDSRLPLSGHAIFPGIAPPGEQEAWVTNALRKIKEHNPRYWASMLIQISETAEDVGYTEELPGHGAVVDLATEHGQPAKNPPAVRASPRRKTQAPRHTRN